MSDIPNPNEVEKPKKKNLTEAGPFIAFLFAIVVESNKAKESKKPSEKYNPPPGAVGHMNF